jgi:hypothetical protein
MALVSVSDTIPSREALADGLSVRFGHYTFPGGIGGWR